MAPDDWTRDDATALWARLISHFPALGGEIGDAVGEMRAKDWIDVLHRYSREDSTATVETLISGTSMGRYPRIGDFQDLMRQRLARRSLEASGRKALTEAPVAPEVGLRGTQASKAALAKTKGFEAPRYVSTGRYEGSGFDPLVPMLEYGQVYLPDGTPRPEFVDEVARQTIWLPGKPESEKAPKPVGTALARVLTDLERQA